MSTLEYNGINLELIRTNNLVQESVTTDDGIDYLYTHILIDVDCIFNPYATSYIIDSSGFPVKAVGFGPEVTDRNVRQFLLQPRKVLIFSDFNPLNVDFPTENQLVVSPVPFTNGPPPNIFGVTDANNGPHPISCTVTRIDGVKTFHVRYVIETWIIRCFNEDDQYESPVLLSNRYATYHDIDEQHLLLKTTSGRAIFRTDILQQFNSVADEFRDQVLPPVSKGMKRTNIKIGISPSANAIDWACEDKEMMVDLGETDARLGGVNSSGIVKFEGSYGVSTLPITGGIIKVGTPISIAQVDMRAWGNKYSNNFTMFSRLMLFAETKIALNTDVLATLGHASFRESMSDRYVEISLMYTLAPKKEGRAGGANDTALQTDVLRGLINQPGVNPAFPNDGGSRGTQPEMILVQKLKEVCSEVQKIKETFCSDALYNSSLSGGTNTGGCPAIQVGFGQFQSPTGNDYSSSMSQDPITYYEILSSYPKQESMVQAPITKSPGSSSSSDPTCEVMQLALPLSQKVCEWRAERIGLIPQIPLPQPTDPNLKLLKSIIHTLGWNMMADGHTRIYYIAGVYTYAALAPQGAGNVLPVDAAPWMDFPLGSAAVSLGDYSPDILGV